MIAFIAVHRATYGVEPICRVLPIAPSTYHTHVAPMRCPGCRILSRHHHGHDEQTLVDLP